MQFLQKEGWMGMEEIVAETTSHKKDKAIGVCVLTALAKKEWNHLIYI